MMLVVGGALAVFAGCVNPLEEGCQYAQGLDKDCNVKHDGRWHGLPAGFPAEELEHGDSIEQRALETLDSELQSAEEASPADEVASAVGSERNRELDGLEEFVIDSYLLHYSNRGTLLNCLVADDTTRANARKLLTRKRNTGRYEYLALGARSSLTSRVFESTFASVDVKAALETDFSKLIDDKAKATAAANAAFAAMTQTVKSGFSAGTYRYVSIRSHPHLWEELNSIHAIRAECRDRKASVAQGVVVVALKQSDWLAEQTTSGNFEAAIEAAVSDLPPSVVGQLKASAKATVNATLKREANKRLKVSLDRPIVVPLRWKADKMN